MVKSFLLSMLSPVFILSVFLCPVNGTDEIPISETKRANHEQQDNNGDSEQWIIVKATCEDMREFTFDWNGDGYPETLGTQFLAAGAQTHYDIVLKDGKSGNKIYSGYAFNAPSYGVCTRNGTTPVIFVRVLGDLKAVVDPPLHSIPCPAPDSSACTATLLCYSYYRLITYRQGSYADVSGEYPGLLWKLMAGNTLKYAPEYLGTDEDLTEIFMLALLYYQARTGVSIRTEWLDAAISSNCEYSSDDILAMVRKHSHKSEHLKEFFRLEKLSLVGKH